MRILSPCESVKEVNRQIRNNSPSSMLGVSASPLSGAEMLARVCMHTLSERSRTFCIEMEAKEFREPAPFYLRLRQELSDSYKYASTSYDDGMDFGDTLYNMVAGLHPDDHVSVILVVTSVETLDAQTLYELVSQLRNLREKIRSGGNRRLFHSIVLGAWSYESISQSCDKNKGSFPFDDYWYLGSLTIDEVADYLRTNTTANIDDLDIQYLFELSRGCYSVVANVSNLSQNNTPIEDMRECVEKMAMDSSFVHSVSDAVNRLYDNDKILLANLLGGRIVLWNKNKATTERFYLSGLIHKTKVWGKEVVQIRSWPHEIVLRKHAKNILKGFTIYNNIDELIPPSSALNRSAYALVMTVENLMRNYIVLTLADIAGGNHPFSVLNGLGKIKKTHSSAVTFTILEYAERHMKRYTEQKELSTHTALSSYLELSDIEQILLERPNTSSTAELKEFDLRIAKVFPDKNELKDLLDNLKDIRNPVAHNNLVSESVVRKLKSICKTLSMKLFIES